MGINERKEREKHEMRRSILDTAMRLFVEQGYENVSIRKIAGAIEYSPATIYLYFSDKDEILMNLQREGFQLFLAELTKCEAVTDPAKRILELGLLYVRFGITHPEYYDLMFIARAPMKKIENPGSWKEGGQSFQVLMRAVDHAIEKGVLKGNDVFSISVGLWSLVHGLVSLLTRERIDLGTEDDLRARVEIVFSAFMAELF